MEIPSRPVSNSVRPCAAPIDYHVCMSPRLRLLLPLFAVLPMFAQTVREEMVTMRDGVHLATSIYLPPGEGPWPVVLTRTPYGKDMMYGPKAHKHYLDARLCSRGSGRPREVQERG